MKKTERRNGEGGMWAEKTFLKSNREDSRSFKSIQSSRSGQNVDVEWLSKLSTKIDNCPWQLGSWCTPQGESEQLFGISEKGARDGGNFNLIGCFNNATCRVSWSTFLLSLLLVL